MRIPTLTAIGISIYLSCIPGYLKAADDQNVARLPEADALAALYHQNDIKELRAWGTRIGKEYKLSPIQRVYLKSLLANADQKPSLPAPAEVKSSISKVSLSDCKWTSAKVDFRKPTRNLFPPEPGMLFLRSAHGLHRSGLYAHANSEYVFDLGGKWETLTGSGTLAFISQFPNNLTSVDFIIEGDGEELLARRRQNKNERLIEFRLNVRGVKTLKLITKEAGNEAYGDWAFWADLELKRPQRRVK